MSDGSPELHEVRILQFPLDVYQRSTEAFEGLQREFALIAMRSEEADALPDRLLRLVSALNHEYGDLTSESDRKRDEAIARGETVVAELVHHVPGSVADACIALNALLDEADEFCRQGELLLTLATTPEGVAFRRWYLGEFIAQVRGEDPLPWSEVDQEALLENPRLRGTAGA